MSDFDALWKAYQLGQVSADHTDKQVFVEVVGDEIERLEEQLGNQQTEYQKLLNQAGRYATKIERLESKLDVVKALPRFNVMKPNPTMDGSGSLRIHATKDGEWIRAIDRDKALGEGD